MREYLKIAAWGVCTDNTGLGIEAGVRCSNAISSSSGRVVYVAPVCPFKQ